MRFLTYLLLFWLISSALKAEAESATARQQNPSQAFLPYPVPDEIIETPAANSGLMYVGIYGAAYQKTGIPAMLMGLSFFLRDFFSVRAEMIIPLKKSTLDDS